MTCKSIIPDLITSRPPSSQANKMLSQRRHSPQPTPRHRPQHHNPQRLTLPRCRALPRSLRRHVLRRNQYGVYRPSPLLPAARFPHFLRRTLLRCSRANLSTTALFKPDCLEQCAGDLRKALGASGEILESDQECDR